MSEALENERPKMNFDRFYNRVCVIMQNLVQETWEGEAPDAGSDEGRFICVMVAAIERYNMAKQKNAQR